MAYKAHRRLRSPVELADLKDEILSRVSPLSRRAILSTGGCQPVGNEDLAALFAHRVAQMREASSAHDPIVCVAGCHGMCGAGPTVEISPPGVLYVHVGLEDVEAIITQTLARGEVVEDLTYWDPETGRHIPSAKDIPYFSRQTRRLLRNCGSVDPRRIEESFARGAYSALARAAQASSRPHEVVRLVEASGLRGRGGAGQPCVEKWASLNEAAPPVRRLLVYVKGWESAAAMDCALLEGDPHLVLEGIALAALATGCEEARLVIPPQREVALQTARLAVEQAEAYGLLGPDVMGAAWPLRVQVETAEADWRPGPLPEALWAGPEGEAETRAGGGVEAGPWLTHNVETVANLPWIVLHGPESFREVGSADNPGTKLVSLGGTLRHLGVVEVPYNMTFRRILEELGGGAGGPEPLRGVHVDGPAGCLLPLQLLDVPLDGSGDGGSEVGLGAGDLVAFDAGECVVARARAAAGSVAGESCGKCAPCRIGTKRVEEILEGFCRCQGAAPRLADLQDLGEVLRWTAGCRQGGRAADCVLSALAHFETDFVAHLAGGNCPAGVCEGPEGGD